MAPCDQFTGAFPKSSMRRSNKSHKVPNVKLRPAPAQPRPPKQHEPDAFCDQSSDSEMPPSASMVDLCPRPFKGFTICATGTMDKPTLFKMAFELGATSTSNLTDRVTHLIADSHGGAKYLCALERKMPIMTPDWITESYTIWLRGDDVDVEQSMSNHRLPIFSGVVLSLSGIEDVHRRTEINRLVTAHQGTYLKNLERPVRVTHLLCSGDTETDKMKYAERFNKRKEAHIHLVWEEWFWDCLEFGGRFDERKYQVSRPRPERKSLNEIPIPSIPVWDFAPGSHPNSAIPVDVVDPPNRLKPMVRTGSFTVISNLQIDGEEEEMAIVNKPVPAVTLQLWQSLLKPRGFELDGGKLVRSPSKSQTMRSPPSTPIRRRAQPNGGNRNEPGADLGKESVISSFRRAHSFAPVSMKEHAVRQPFRRNTTCPMVCPGEAKRSGLHEHNQPGELVMPAPFAGYTFRLLGEARCTNVRLAIENGGGVVVDDDAEEPCFIIVRLISGSKLCHDEFDDHIRSKYRTECWLEHSVFHERICEPDENISFTPLKIVTPVSDAENVHLSLSGLDQSELCWIRRLVRAVGITLEPTFSRRTTHLLCPSGAGAKFDKAVEWRTPVVSLAWLEHVARAGTIPPVDEYLIGGSPVGATINELLGPVPKVKGGKGKGKGKEQEVDCEFNARHHCDKTLGEPSFPSRNRLFGKPRLLTDDPGTPEEAEGHGSNPAPDQPGPHACAPTQTETHTLTPAQVRIPSSTSPSPMKLLPSSSIPNAFVPSSPAHLPDTDTITKALHERLTSLLGKRPTMEDDRNEAIHDMGTGARGAKKGKRVRPGGPSNVPSRNPSRENVIVVSPQRLPIMPPRVPPVDLEVSMSLLDGLEMDAVRSTEESLRVMYEDPGQAEEKRRLLRMLGEDERDVGMVPRVTVGVGNEAGRARRIKRTKGLRS